MPAAGRTWVRRLRLRGIATGFAIVVGSIVVAALAFHVTCEGEPGPRVAPQQDTSAWQATYPEYKRAEESTYLTTLEWYQVFSYQEYAGHVATEPPSRFPYFAAVGQSWSMYCHAYGATEDTYAFNGGNHLMLGVIGTSFAAEYAAKGVWDNTIGWLTEWDTHQAPEDQFAAGVHDEYGTFIETDPWYAYPFGARTGALWADTDADWSHPIRTVERRAFLTAEFGVKAGYAFLIREATGAIYGAPPALDYVWLTNSTPEALQVKGVQVVEELGNGSTLVTIPHYQGFTNAIPELARMGAHFEDISGNGLIVATLQVPEGQGPPAPATEWFRHPVLVATGTDRLVVRVEVAQLDAFVMAADVQGARIEHLFDY